MKSIVHIQFFLIVCLFFSQIKAQQPVNFVHKQGQQTVEVMVGGKYFTSFCYSEKMDKPVLFPILTASGVTVTRGFPLANRPNERTDHPHHIGLWFNYGDVNGLDFWNNSYAIKESEKPKYGTIRHQQIMDIKDGSKNGQLSVTANWIDINNKVLLKEVTLFEFSGDANRRYITRTTTLTASDQKVMFKDNKEGLLGLRLARELEIPSQKAEIFTDAQGIATKVAVLNNDGVTGNFLSSSGLTGNDVWGTKGNWCMSFGQKNGDSISVIILDHPANPGYPSYWHARGYGLFAANPLGQEIFSNGKEKLNFSLESGASVTFKYRVIIQNGKIPTAQLINKEAAIFSRQ